MIAAVRQKGIDFCELLILLAQFGFLKKLLFYFLLCRLKVLLECRIFLFLIGKIGRQIIDRVFNSPDIAQGINTDTMKLLGLMLSNGLVAFSGALIAQNQRYADITMGQGAIVIGLASVIIGEVLFDRGGFLRRFFSMALGAVIYRIIIAFVIELGMQPTDLRLFTAITVAAALSIPNIQGKAITLFRPRRVSAGCAVQSK